MAGGDPAEENLPELSRAAERRFQSRPPDLVFRDGTDRVGLWDADDFDPRESLEWETVRVIRYRQHQPNGEVVEAYWLTNFSSRQMSRRCLYAKGLLWLLTCLALTLERLYRLRYLHRGVHPVRTAIDLLRLLVFGPSIPVVSDSS